jgi:hypothetical protein
VATAAFSSLQEIDVSGSIRYVFTSSVGSNQISGQESQISVQQRRKPVQECSNHTWCHHRLVYLYRHH